MAGRLLPLREWLCWWVLPLAVNSGAGSGAQNAVGVTVVGGVLAATVLGVYLTPLQFAAVHRWFSSKV